MKLKQDRQCTNTNNEERSYNHCCSKKAGSIIYSKGAFVALIIQHGMRMRHIVICILPDSTILSHKGMIFAGGGGYWTQNVWFHFLCNFYLKHFPFYEEMSEISKIYSGLHVKYPLFFSDFNETWTFSTVIRKILTFQISQKSFQWNRIVPRGRTDMTKLIVALNNLAKRLRNEYDETL